ncbi:MAG TPA: DUF4397 domain-containing protein [Terriglobales bacterium]|nr:DUF4397 domain-containing protein [Terriglobales bacterium]
MKNCIRLIFVLAFVCAALNTAMFASDNAYLYLVHGIPGRDDSPSADPAFPVDILLNDEVCYERGFSFGSVAGPLTLAPGNYDVKVSVANSLAPCSNSPLIERVISLEGGKDFSAVVALSPAGPLTLLTFDNQFAPVSANAGRLLFAQAADAPTLDLILQNKSTMKLYAYTVSPGALLDVNLPAGDYTVEINQGTTTLATSTSLDLYSQSVTLLYAVGQASNNTVTLETKTVRSVI